VALQASTEAQQVVLPAIITDYPVATIAALNGGILQSGHILFRLSIQLPGQIMHRHVSLLA
jgi:hypothetical protein